MPILVGVNAAVATGMLFDLNLTNLAAWTLLGGVMKGFAVSVVSPSPAPPAPLSAEQLQPYVTQLVSAVNTARSTFSHVFNCTDPRLALRAALVLYAAALVSARVPVQALAWLAFNLAFALPALAKSSKLPAVDGAVQYAKQKVDEGLAHPKSQQLVQAWAQPQLKEVVASVRSPKAQFLGAALFWFMCLSWFNKVLSLSFGCLYLKSQGVITTNTEEQVGEAVDQLKKRARRMTISAGAMLARKPKAE